MIFQRLLKSDLVASAVLFALAFPQRFVLTSQGYFAFNYDQGRDFLAVSKILSGDIVLIGQTTGIEGIFYGPWWYYFLTPIVFISGGDPQIIANIFSILGTLTIVGIYLLLKKITGNTLISFLLALFAAISSNWMLGSTNIWNPTLTPIFLLVFIFSLHKITENKKAPFYFLLGLSSFLAFDTTASFGILLVLYVIASPIIFRKTFFNKKFLFTILGGFLIVLPRIIFEIKNNFLMSKTFITYINEPSIYGERLTLVERFFARLEQFSNLFVQTFANNNLFIALFLLILFLIITVQTLHNKKIVLSLKKDFLAIYLLTLLLLTFIFFIIFPDTVWDYYLVGIPLVILVLLGKLLKQYSAAKKNFKTVLAFLVLILLLNLRANLYPPYNITWQGDDSTYKNPKLVMEYIASQKPRDYNYFSYTPAIFDYPFDYLFDWYSKKGYLKEPNPDSNILYLIIRETSTSKYLNGGWYGDKTRDNTKLVDEKEFPGDILVEKHVKNE